MPAGTERRTSSRATASPSSSHVNRDPSTATALRSWPLDKRGAVHFVCGEETALLASIEGKRGLPRPRPPYPAQEGLWGCPTLINNVETFANIPPLIRNGGEWFAGIGTDKSKGTKVFALAGRVNNTGLIEVPMGITLREIVFDRGGPRKRYRAAGVVSSGWADGHRRLSPLPR
jgi:bidirectional [NiFe] hydrogenase diaphorase subunit